MPKEVIYNSESFGESDKASMVELHWGRNGYVQIATTLREGSTHEPVERMVNAGWFINLDRTGINELIKVLRRARDQAYGADE